MTNETSNQNYHPGHYWHLIDDGRIQCDLCPRDCKLHEGQRGACFVRMRQDNQIVLTTYGRSSGFCIDPIEKKPLTSSTPAAAYFLLAPLAVTWPVSSARTGISANPETWTD